MNPPSARRHFRPGRFFRLGLRGIIVLLLLLAAQPAAAQIQLSEREARYRESVSRYNQLVVERERAFARQVDASDQLERLRNTPERDASFSVFIDRMRELTSVERRLEEALDALRQRGDELIAELDEEEARVLDQIQTATLPTVRQALADRLANLGLRRREVQQELAGFAIPVIEPLPDLTVNPRDGPTQLRIKAGIYEERAEEYRLIRESLDLEIQGLERRIQRERAMGSLSSEVRRESDRAPGGGVLPRPTQPRPGDRATPDTTQVRLAQLPLSEQLEVYREIRERAEDLRVQALAQADLFRRRAEGGLR